MTDEGDSTGREVRKEGGMSKLPGRKRRKIDGGQIVALIQVSEMEENNKLKDLCLVLRGSSASLRPDNERAA